MLRGFTPQAALDAPRFCISAGTPDSDVKNANKEAGDINSEVFFEEGISDDTVAKMRCMFLAIWTYSYADLLDY